MSLDVFAPEDIETETNANIWIIMNLIFLIYTIYCFFPNGAMNT